jgi:hypothetical protein
VDAPLKGIATSTKRAIAGWRYVVAILSVDVTAVRTANFILRKWVVEFIMKVTSRSIVLYGRIQIVVKDSVLWFGTMKKQSSIDSHLMMPTF